MSEEIENTYLQRYADVLGTTVDNLKMVISPVHGYVSASAYEKAGEEDELQIADHRAAFDGASPIPSIKTNIIITSDTS